VGRADPVVRAAQADPAVTMARPGLSPAIWISPFLRLNGARNTASARAGEGHVRGCRRAHTRLHRGVD
jgi:hypothetical protein